MRFFLFMGFAPGSQCDCEDAAAVAENGMPKVVAGRPPEGKGNKKAAPGGPAWKGKNPF